MPSHIQKIIFVIGVAVCLLPIVSPPIALALGLALGLSLGHPFADFNRKATKILLQISVVGLGFGIDLAKVVDAGRTGIILTLVTIIGTLTLGFLVGKWLKISTKTSHLISSGTAICGGSAIAAIGPVLNADEKEMSVALGTIFILNSIALFIFPILGHMLNLSQTQFGMWAAIAIHDTSSVVGAGARYGAEALSVATTVKLARTLWIVPLVVLTSVLFKQKNVKIVIPYFIGFFLLASFLRSSLPVITSFSTTIVAIAKTGLTVTLFLIGAGLSRSMMKAVGIRPFVHGVVLWLIISVVSLWLVVGIF